MSPRTRHPLSIEYVLLGFLSRGPLHGYEIYQLLLNSDGPGLIWRVGQSKLYALLGRLEDDGYVAARTEEQVGRPARRILALTEVGQEAYREWVSAPVDSGRAMRNDFLARLYFAIREGDGASERLISQQRNVCSQWLAGQSSILQAGPGTYTRLVAGYRRSQIAAMLSWLDDCETSLPKETGSR